MDSEFRAFLDTPDEEPVKRLRRKGYSPFNWAVFLLLLTGFAFASWITSFYVVQHPEDPRCYKILQALNKIDPLKRFEVTAAPPGRFYTAKDLYDAYLTISQPEIDQKNGALLRDYLRNYTDSRTLVPYVAGHFKAMGVYELRSSDMFPSGVVAVAESVDCPQVMIEHVYTTEASNIPKVRRMLAMNPDIVLEKTFDLSAIVHAEKMQDGKFLFTVVPLGYGNYAFKQGISSTFRLDPPHNVNLVASLPLVKPDIMPEAVKMFAQYRKTKGMLAQINTPVFPDAVPQTASRSSGPAITPPPVEESVRVLQSGVVIEAPADPAPAEIAASTPVPELAALPAASVPESTVVNGQAVSQSVPDSVPVIAQTRPAVPQAPSVPSEPAAQPQVMINPAQQASAPVAQSQPVAEPSSVQPMAVVPSQPQPQKIIAKTAPALKAITPTVGKPIAHVSPGPSFAQIIAAMHGPTPKTKIVATVNASPSPARSLPVATPFQVARAIAVVPVPPQPEPEEQQQQPVTNPSTFTNGVKFEPFMASQSRPQPVTQPAPQTTWHTYQPGQMPRGKLLDWQNAPELAEVGINNEQRYYIRGKYVVTASSENRVVLRPQGYGSEPVSTVRVVVEFPKGAQMPVEGARVARGEMRPFQIVNVRRGNDGQVNVYAREVTTPWQVTNTTDLLRAYHQQRERLANQYMQ